LPSPDGTWILVRPRLGASRRVAVSYDGRRTITVELSPFDTAIWLTKSGMFATDFESNVFPSTTLTYHSLLNPARQRQEMLAPTPRNDTNVTSLARPDPFSTPGPAAPPIADEQNVQAVPVSITADGRLLQRVGGVLHGKWVNSYRTAALSAARSRRIYVPQGDHEDVQDVQASPDGRQLAWFVWRHPTPGPRWWDVLKAKLHVAKGDVMRLIVTDVATDRVTIIGSVPVRPHIQTLVQGPAYLDSNGPKWLRWLPNGRELSYVYRDRLWTVPVGN